MKAGRGGVQGKSTYCKPRAFLYCCSVSKSCPTLCDPMNCSTPGSSVLHHLLLLLSHISCVRLCATPQMAAHRLLCPWDSPGKNTGVGCHFLLLDLLKFMSVELVMLSHHLILCCPLLFHLQSFPTSGSLPMMSFNPYPNPRIVALWSGASSTLAVGTQKACSPMFLGCLKVLNWPMAPSTQRLRGAPNEKVLTSAPWVLCVPTPPHPHPQKVLLFSWII